MTSRIPGSVLPAHRRNRLALANISPMLLGRETELGACRELLDRARGGHGGALVVHGEPGVGKSSLLAAAAAGAAGFQVLTTQGIESESPLAFAALHRLLIPLLDRVDRLPAPQATALRAV